MAAKDIIITAGLDLSSFQDGSNRLAKTLTALDSSIYRDTFTNIDAASVALRNFGGAVLSVAESIPIVGGFIGGVADEYGKLKQQYHDLGAATNQAAESQDQLIEKFKNIRDAQIEIRKGGTHGGALAETEAQATKALTQTAEQFIEVNNKVIDSYNQSNIAIKERVELQKLEIEQRAKYASLENKLRINGMGIGKSGAKILASGFDLIQKETEQREKALKFSISQQEAQQQLNKELAKTDHTLQSQESALTEIYINLKQQEAVARRIYGEGSLIASMYEKQANDASLALSNFIYQNKVNLQSAQDAVAVKNQELAGNEKLTALLQNQLEIEKQIRDAKRQGNMELADALAKQGALTKLEILANDAMKSPKQRREERKQQRRSERAQRLVEARDRVNKAADERGAFGRLSNRDRISPGTQAARDRFVQRNKGAFMQKDNAIEARDFRVTTLTVKTLEME